MTTNPIIEKIKKLLALADNSGATEGERDNALRMAFFLKDGSSNPVLVRAGLHKLG